MKYYIGVDISKHRLDVDWLGKPIAFANNADEIKRFVTLLRKLLKEDKLAMVLCEASGGYEQKLVKICHTKKLPVHVAHANHIKYFAKSRGIKAKTDPIDAKVISAYGRERKPEPDHFMLNENTLEIKELLKRREQLMLDKKREQSRLDKIENAGITKSIHSHIDYLNDAIKETDGRLAELQKIKSIRTPHDLLTSVPGVGKVVAYYLIANLPELGKLSHKAIAALVGVAPYNHDSGRHQGKRYIQGGRSRLRQVLYMAAMTGLTHNPDLKVFYARLCESGKPGKVAMVAVMRKLLSMVNSVMSRGTPWQEIYQKA